MHKTCETGSKNLTICAYVFGLALLLLHSRAAELIADAHFQRGLILWDPQPGQHRAYGQIDRAGAQGQAIWGLSQWSSKFPLDPTRSVTNADSWLVWSNAAKWIGFPAPDSRVRNAADLLLAVNSFAEYGANARTSGQPWIHLLAEQEFAETPFLDELRAASFHVEAKLSRAENLHRGDYDPGLHAAQFQVFFTLQNRRRESPGFGDFLWFGIPLYDSRHRHPPEFKSPDFGGTGKFIFTPSGTVFSALSAHDREWFTIDRDLLPLFREALAAAWAKGFLQKSHTVGDYAVGGMNLGWELPGTFDVEMRIRNLSLKVQPALPKPIRPAE